MIEAVVFDMDGVLVDTEPHWAVAERDILEAALPAGHDVEPTDIMGINVHEQYDLLAGEYEPELSREAYFARFDEAADGVYERAAAMPGLHDFLEAIEDRGVPIGLCTSSYPRWIDVVFETHDLGGRFDEVVSAADADVPGKPEPDSYELLAERLGVDAEAMLVIEDSPNGVTAARRAGAYTVAYVAGGDSEAERPNADPAAERPNADVTVRDPETLREHVLARLDERP